MKRLLSQLMRFGVIGVVAFAIDYALLVLLTEVVGLGYLVSATASYVISTAFNYTASMRYVFRHREGMTRVREFALFLVGSLIGLGINDVGMWAGVEMLGMHYLVSKLLVTAVVAIWNFVTRKLFLDADTWT